MKAAAARTTIGFRNILFATDFSAASAHAIPYVKRLVKHYQANLAALHVRPPFVNPMMASAETWAIDADMAKAEDEHHRKELLRSFAGIQAQVLIEAGDIQSRLQAAMETNHTDLVVIGTRGRTGIVKFLLGSVAEEIFRTVNCPVLTVGPHAVTSRGADGEIREILCATDFTSESYSAVAHAVSLAQEFQARLILLHVVPEPKAGDLVPWSEVQAYSKALLRRLVPLEAEAWCKPEYFVERGDPAERILDLANLREMDLIVLGVHQKNGSSGAATHLHNATAHKVVSHATCPVLTVRS